MFTPVHGLRNIYVYRGLLPVAGPAVVYGCSSRPCTCAPAVTLTLPAARAPLALTAIARNEATAAPEVFC